MKTIYVSDKTPMTLESMKNISENHTLYKTFYKKEVEDDFTCNVCGNAIVYDKAIVYDNATVYDNAQVFGNAIVYDNAKVFGSAKIFENATVQENAKVCGNAIVGGNAIVCGNAIVGEDAIVGGNAIVGEDAIVGGSACVFGGAEVYGGAKVFEMAQVCGDSRVCENAQASTNTYSLNFLKYNVTLTDNHIKIGCKQFTYERALKLSKRDTGHLFHENEYNDVIKDKKLIIELIKRKRPDLFIKAKKKEVENGKVFE